jgi:ABC-2 type transport system permease protein
LIRYYSNQPTYNDVRRWLERVANDRARGVRLAAAGLDRSIVEKAMTPVGVENLGLVERTDSGAIKEAETVNPIATFMVPFALIMLMWVALAMTVQPILNGVIEEKMQRISEVLLGSVPPFELMLGKLIGYVGVAITLVGLYMIGGWTVANHLGKTDMVPVELIGWFVLFLTIAILMFGSLFLAAGACCNDLKEAQNLVLPIWIIAAFPLIAMPVVLEHPNSPFAIGLSLVPTASPMLMVLRMAVPPGIAWWELPVSIVGSLAATLLFVWVAGRIFRVGMLMQGKPPKITEIAGWVLRG